MKKKPTFAEQNLAKIHAKLDVVTKKVYQNIDDIYQESDKIYRIDAVQYDELKKNKILNKHNVMQVLAGKHSYFKINPQYFEKCQFINKNIMQLDWGYRNKAEKLNLTHCPPQKKLQYVISEQKMRSEKSQPGIQRNGDLLKTYPHISKIYTKCFPGNQFQIAKEKSQDSQNEINIQLLTDLKDKSMELSFQVKQQTFARQKKFVDKYKFHIDYNNKKQSISEFLQL